MEGIKSLKWVQEKLSTEGSLVVMGSSELEKSGVFESQSGLLESSAGQALFNQLSSHFVVCQIHLSNVQEDENLNALKMHTIFFRGISAIDKKARKSGKPLVWLLSVDRSTYEGKVGALISCVARIRKEFPSLSVLMLLENGSSLESALQKEEPAESVSTFVHSFLKNKSTLAPFEYAKVGAVGQDDTLGGIPLLALSGSEEVQRQEDTGSNPKKSGVWSVFVAGFASALLLWVFLLYTKAPFMVQLSQMVWSCS